MNLLPGSSEAAVLALINGENPQLPVPLAEGDLYFGRPKTLPSGRVEIPAVAMYDSTYEGYVKFEYQRLSLTKAFGNIRPRIRAVGYPTLHQLLPVVNKILGTTFGPSDIIDMDLSKINPNENANIKISASLASLGYEGWFVMTFTRIRPLLQEAVEIKNLNAMAHPVDPETGLLSLSMHTYSIDFTGSDRELMVYPTGIWQNLSLFRTMMATHGFNNWPQGKAGEVRSYAAKDLPEANKDFTNVVVQRNLEIDGYAGDAYFHYNRS